jgi:FkbM family methyltransferase
LVVSPPILKNQLIYDKKNYKFFTIKIANIIDWCTVTQIFYDNDYGIEKLARRREIEDYYAKILASGEAPLIVDCGANIGLATNFFSRTYPKSRILGIEPDSKNVEQARINNYDENVLFLEAAVGNVDMHGRIVDPGLGNWGYRIEDDKDGCVKICSINTLIDGYQKKKLKPFIIKIDIEGYENRLFSSNTEWINEFPVLIIELHDGIFPCMANSGNFLKEIAKLNRDFLFYGENIFSLSNPISRVCSGNSKFQG